MEAPQQYRELLDYLASTVLELQQKLPPDLGVLLPELTYFFDLVFHHIISFVR